MATHIVVTPPIAVIIRITTPIHPATSHCTDPAATHRPAQAAAVLGALRPHVVARLDAGAELADVEAAVHAAVAVAVFLAIFTLVGPWRQSVTGDGGRCEKEGEEREGSHDGNPSRFGQKY